MADIADNGNDTADVFLRAALSKRQYTGPKPAGYCHNCEEPFPDDPKRVYCDSDCREDYEFRKQRENSQ